MCQKVEDCLLSKLGFRLFITVVFIIIVIVLSLNIQFLTRSNENIIGNELFSKIKELSKDQRGSPLFSSNQRHGTNDIAISNLDTKTKILIWMTNFEETEGARSSFYAEFSHRVRRLRKNECPILNECSFASHKRKLHKADAVVILRTNNVSNMHNKLPSHSGRKKKPLKGIKQRIPDNQFISDFSKNGLDPSVAKLKVWLLLIQTPYDQRLIQNASQYLRKTFGVDEFNYHISYMPNSAIPLVRYKLSKISSDYNHDMNRNKNSHREKSNIDHGNENSLRKTITGYKTFATDNHHSKYGSISRNEFQFNQNGKGYGNRNLLASSDIKKNNVLGSMKLNVDASNKEASSTKSNKYAVRRLRAYASDILRSRANVRSNTRHIDDIPKNVQSGSRYYGPIRSKKYSDIQTVSLNLNGQRIAATIMNECTSEGNREGYIREMRKGINVDVYGKCGAPCPGNTEEDCLQYLSNFYTFILVFETHVCQHYLSPQLLRVLNLRQQSMIPVVFGGINYNELFSSNGLESNIYENNNTWAFRKGNMKRSGNTHEGKKLDSHNTFETGPALFMIDALGQTPSALSHYLKHLVNTDLTEITTNVNLGDYIRWKKEYQFQLKEWPCLLCEKLRYNMNKKEEQVTKYQNINKMRQGKLSSELCTRWPTLDFSGG